VKHHHGKISTEEYRLLYGHVICFSVGCELVD